MTKDQSIEWLKKLEAWFENRAEDSQEDIEIQSYLQNATTAKKIAELIVAMQ